LEQGRRAKLDIEERRHFAQMLRGYRATLAMELRTFNESVIDRRAGRGFCFVLSRATIGSWKENK
jgi:hypothetical protein